MKYVFDHDFHIHSQLSSCSRDPEQNNERILKYAEDEGLHTIVLADHFWDERVPGASKWYSTQNYPHICQAKPLPQSEKVKFLFGCETEMDKDMTVGCSREIMEELDFIVIPTTHFHLEKFTIADEALATPETRAQVWVDKLDALLAMDLPFEKIGITPSSLSMSTPIESPFSFVAISELPLESFSSPSVAAAQEANTESTVVMIIKIEISFSQMYFITFILLIK